MASAALGSAYLLTNDGAKQLLELTKQEAAPLAAPGFVSRREDDRNVRHERLIELNRAAERLSKTA